LASSAHVGKETDVLVGAGDAQAGNLIWRPPVQQVVVEENLAFVEPVETGDAVEEGGLPRAIRPDDTDDGVLGNLEVKRVNRRQAAEVFGNLLGSKNSSH
jgi:hypothetical protein